jgi:hypothetical protein
MVIPSRVLPNGITGVETGNGTSMKADEGTVQTTNPLPIAIGIVSSENCSSKHNPKVTGSIPVFATKTNIGSIPVFATENQKRLY